MSETPHPCPECTPTSQRFCGFCLDGPYSSTGPFAIRASRSPREVTKESLLAEFDAMAERHRSEAKARGGSGSAPAADTTRPSGRKARTKAVPPDSPSRCIETIPTAGKTLAHQCRNKKKYGDYCGLHATNRVRSDDFEQAPAALVDAPDTLPWMSHEDP